MGATLLIATPGGRKGHVAAYGSLPRFFLEELRLEPHLFQPSLRSFEDKRLPGQRVPRGRGCVG
jgi:hypothetical protein